MDGKLHLTKADEKKRFMNSDPALEENCYLPDGILHFGELHFIIQVYFISDLDSIFRKMQI